MEDPGLLARNSRYPPESCINSYSADVLLKEEKRINEINLKKSYPVYSPRRECLRKVLLQARKVPLLACSTASK
jgi:hypothetical protein